MVKSVNVVRKIMLQLKTGYLKEEPKIYQFMRRNPPFVVDKLPMTKIHKRDIPYLKYYDKAVKRNPLYADEKVYPAFWYQEPQALTLAKKQYELIRSGLDEDAAYLKAVDHVNIIENESYLALREIFDIMQQQGAQLPTTVSDQDLSDTIAKWRQKLKDTPYLTMDLADRGEIDFIIQTKILKWNEVDRERRMKDPIFVMQFQKLRHAVFPEILDMNEAKLARHEKVKRDIMRLFGVNKDNIRTNKPFFYEDYEFYFTRLVKQPLLSRWSESDRSNFSKWIVDSLAIVEVLEKNPTSFIQRYLDLLRGQFFPMVTFPDKAKSFRLPSIQEFREVLYKNDVGYRVDSEFGKLYVRRFYRIPLLLFPNETITSSVLFNRARTKEVASDPEELRKEIRAAGVSEQALPDLQKVLEQYMKANDLHAGTYGGGRGLGAPPASRNFGMEMSALDALLKDIDVSRDVDLLPESKRDAVAPTPGNSLTEGGDGVEEIRSGESGGNQQGIEDSQAEVGGRVVVLGPGGADAEEGGAALKVDGDIPDIKALESLAPTGILTAGEMLDPFYPRPDRSTALESDRDDWLNSLGLQSWDEAAATNSTFSFHRMRVDAQVITRARCSVEYEEKEAARRHREWVRRGVMLVKLPAAPLNVGGE